jgi:hypothetical protein
MYLLQTYLPQRIIVTMAAGSRLLVITPQIWPLIDSYQC